MKAKTAKMARRLEDIPNIGKAVAEDLRLLGINTPEALIGKNGLDLYHQLNKKTGVIHDPCMADTFMAAVDFMNGGPPKPWWEFTAKRKVLLKSSSLNTHSTFWGHMQLQRHTTEPKF